MDAQVVPVTAHGRLGFKELLLRVELVKRSLEELNKTLYRYLKFSRFKDILLMGFWDAHSQTGPYRALLKRIKGQTHFLSRTEEKKILIVLWKFPTDR